MDWSEQKIDSSSFNKQTYKNPPTSYNSVTFTNKDVQVGSYLLSSNLVTQVCMILF